MTKTSLFLCFAAACGAPCGSAPSPSATWYDSGTPVTKVVGRTVLPSEVGDLTWRTGADVPFRPTTLSEREGFAVLVPELFAAVRSKAPGDPGRFAERLHDIGFRLEVWTAGTTQVWAVLEEQSRRRGAGAYLFRIGPPRRRRSSCRHPTPTTTWDGDMAARLFLQPPRGRPRARCS